jgi:hypothetical protein
MFASDGPKELLFRHNITAVLAVMLLSIAIAVSAMVIILHSSLGKAEVLNDFYPEKCLAFLKAAAPDCVGDTRAQN